MALATESIAIAFHSDKAVVVRLTKGVTKVTAKGGMIIPLQPQRGFYVETPEQVAAAISDRLEQMAWKPDRISIAVPRNLAIVQTVQIPVVAVKDIKQIMQFELERHIPTNASDYYYDVLPQGEIGNNQLSVLLVAIPKQALDQYLKIASLLNLPIEGVDLNPLAQVNSYLALRTIENGDRVMLVHIDEYEIDYAVFDSNRVYYLRTLPRPPLSDDGFQAEIEQLKQQIASVERMVRPTAGKTVVSKLVLTGPVAVEKTLAEEVFRQTQIMTTFHNPYQELQPEPADYISTIPYCTAIGVALRSLNDKLLNLNLMPVERRFLPKRQGIVIAGLLLGIISALAISMIVAGFMHQSIALASLKATIATLEPQVQEIIKGNDDYRLMQEKIDLFRTRELEIPKKLDLLLELTNRLPDGADNEAELVWLTSLNIKENEMTIRGISDSPENLIQILEDSEYFESVKFDSSGITKQGFVIKMNVSKLRTNQIVNPEDGAATQSDEPAPGEASQASSEAETAQQPKPAPENPTAIPQPQPDTSTTDDDQPNRGMSRGLPPRREPAAAQEDTQPMDFQQDENGEQEPEMDLPSVPIAGSTEFNPLSEEDINLDDTRENLFEFLRKHRENADAPVGTPPPGAKSFIEFLQQTNQATEESAGDGQPESEEPPALPFLP